MPFGAFPQQITDVTTAKTTEFIGRLPKTIETPVFHYGESQRTLYRDLAMLSKRFPALATPNIKFSPDMQIGDYFNGTDAHNWYIHMEDNLNRATGQFHRDNYLKFTRLVNVAWTGDVFGGGAINELFYMANEAHANNAGHRLVPLIQQLKKEGIAINIIAHSLGCRTLLSAMNDLGTQGHRDIIDHVFLWEAAVPNTALSNNPQRDTTIKNNAHFPEAYKSAKKITVLYSSHDAVLSIAFWAASHVGVSPNKLLKGASWHEKLKHTTMPMTPEEQRTINKYMTLLNEHYGLELISALTDAKIPDDFMEKHQKLSVNVNKILDKYRIHGALGHSGPDPYDSFTNGLIQSGKILAVNQSKWLFSHSGMKNPSPALMKHVYEDIIMKKTRGLKQFGRYQL